MKGKGGLGRDFYSLLDDNVVAKNKDSAGVKLRIADIEPRGDQPRKTFTLESLQQLADSIMEFGVLQPIIVTENEAFPGSYLIVAGERRWRAAKMAGLSEIPAIILDGDAVKAAQVAVIENVQRENLNPVEEAMAYRSLMDRLGMTQEQVAKQAGKSRSAITNLLRVLELPEDALKFLQNGSITEGHARALLALKNKERAGELAQKIADNGLSVRDVERMIALWNYEKPEQDEGEVEKLSQRKAYLKVLERKVSKNLERKAKIVTKGNKKMLELPFKDDDDLTELLTKLCGEDIFDGM